MSEEKKKETYEKIEKIFKTKPRYELQCNGTTLEQSNNLKQVEKAFDKCSSRIVVLYEVDGAGDKKVLKKAFSPAVSQPFKEFFGRKK